ncbi:MAG: hypothetical protein A2086_01095 [Spirochaetes bacterium GWD1_27_9]|nr:MAG: hypothetical protein A2Z98_16025 [Spirochaetes bacterium GWB1_27_13]OHD33648.1 MAG: hypothetical protein A2086_01095 [Spirochaetes bacterium GWD1_27_9]
MIRFLKILFSYIYSWFVFGILLLTNVLFIVILEPPFFLGVLLLPLDLILIISWGLLQIKSPYFTLQLNNILQRINVDQLNRTLKKCNPDFKQKANNILKLLGTITQEFKEKHSLEEIDSLVDNLFLLSENNKTLYQRWQQFGTAEQRAIMQNKIKQQVNSLNETYQMLQAFSGNLTLLEANFNEVNSISNKLKYINQTIQDLIKGE